MTYIFYSKNAAHGRGMQQALALSKTIEGGAQIRALENFRLVDLFSVVEKEDRVILLGGDGTINHLINSPTMYPCSRNLFYAPGGSGNDFYRDVRESERSDIFPLTPYLQKLPTVKFGDRYLRFLNGVGFGLDGYACAAVAAARGQKKKPPHYATIALKGLLWKFKPMNATVTIDGVTHWFRDVYIATAMFGRYYGGGVKIAPEQDRKVSDSLSVVIAHGPRFAILPVFAKIFKGTHIHHKKYVTILRGNQITVKFDRACAMQVDGDVYPETTSYTVTAPEPKQKLTPAEQETAVQQ